MATIYNYNISLLTTSCAMTAKIKSVYNIHEPSFNTKNRQYL